MNKHKRYMLLQNTIIVLTVLTCSLVIVPSLVGFWHTGVVNVNPHHAVLGSAIIIFLQIVGEAA